METEPITKKPRTRKAKKANPAQELLDALKFVSQVNAKKGIGAQTHCRIKDGFVSAFGGKVFVSHPVKEDLNACPHTFNLIGALSKLDESVSITQLSDLEISVNTGALSVSVECAEVEIPEHCPNIWPIGGAVKAALGFCAPIPRDDEKDLVRSSVLLQNGSAVATCGMVVGEYWHGFDLPTMILPKQLAKVVGSASFNLVGFGYDGTKCSFWFDNGAVVSSFVSKGNYVNYKPLFETELVPAPIPEGFFKGLEGLQKVAEIDIVEFSESGLVIKPKGSNVNSVWKVDGLPVGMRFISRQLLQADKMQSVIFDEERNITRFFGENSRMIVAALDR